MEVNKKEMNLFKKTISSILIIAGIITILFINNTITGRAIGGENTNINLMELVITFWSFLLIITGIWMGFKKEKNSLKNEYIKDE